MRYWPLVLLAGCAALPPPAADRLTGRTRPGAVAWIDYSGPVRPTPARVEVAVVEGRMDPAVALVPRGGEVVFVNRDRTAHGLRAEATFNDPFNMVVSPGGSATREFDRGERIPFRCALHTEAGWIVVMDHPFYAVAGADGRFDIVGVPAGRYAIRAWHPSLGETERLVDVRNGVHVDLPYPAP